MAVEPVAAKQTVIGDGSGLVADAMPMALKAETIEWR